MQILRGLQSFPADLSPSVAALGAFDGIHLAHSRILSTAVERARALGASAVACTFDPHPAAVLQPDRAPLALASLEENLARIAEHGLDAALVIAFTLEFSRTDAQTFVEEILVRTLGAREVVVGFNHTFGRGAAGTPAMLQELGARHGFGVRVLPPLEVGGRIVSSSAIREAISSGDVGLARELLGRPYSVTGVVLRGAGRGRTLGFPTANIRPDRPLVLASGVYVARASWGGASADAVVNIGHRPTFEEHEYWVEAYLLDFSGDLYERTLTLHFLEWIRPEKKFPGVDALTRQVVADVETARRMLKARPASV